MLTILATTAAFADNHCDSGGPDDAGLITLNGGNYATIDDAVADAGTGDTIFVCQGSYPTSAVIEKSITLFGVDGPDLTRLDGIFDPSPFPSVVWVLKVRAPGQSAIQIDGFSIVGEATTFSGIQVTASSELLLTNSKLFGNETALQIDRTANLVLLGSEVFGNSNTGILALGDNVLNLDGSSIFGNFGRDGGGLSLGDGVTVVGGDVFANQADRGGGVYTEGAVVLIGTQIHDNTAEQQGGGVFVDLFSGETGGLLTALGVDISANYAWEDGGGIYAEVPIPDMTSQFTALDLERCTLTDNRADASGGGVWSGARTVTTTETSIATNHSGMTGGGLFIRDTDPVGATYTGLLVEGNDALSCAGMDVDRTENRTTFVGATLIGNVALFDGGGVCVDRPWSTARVFAGVTFQGATILENEAGTNGGGIRFQGDQSDIFSESKITESLIESNVAKSGGALDISSHDVEVTGSVVKGNVASEGAGARLLLTGSFLPVLSSNASIWENEPFDVEYTAGPTFEYGSKDFDCDGNTCVP